MTAGYIGPLEYLQVDGSLCLPKAHAMVQKLTFANRDHDSEVIRAVVAIVGLN